MIAGLLELLPAEKLRVVVDQVFPLSEAARRTPPSRAQSFGRVLLVPYRGVGAAPSAL